MSPGEPILEPTERRSAERDEMRRRILDAARALFVERGYEHTTLRDIGRAIGYTPPAVYTYFPTKHAILLAVCNDDFRALQAGFDAVEHVPDPVERLRLIGRGYVEFAKTHKNQYRLMFMTPLPEHGPEEVGIERWNPDQDAYAFLRKHVAEAIAAGRFRAELGDADLVAQALWGSVHGVVALHETKGEDAWCAWRSLDETAALVIDGLIRGMVREERP